MISSVSTAVCTRVSVTYLVEVGPLLHGPECGGGDGWHGDHLQVPVLLETGASRACPPGLVLDDQRQRLGVVDELQQGGDGHVLHLRESRACWVSKMAG